jgi:chorismate dehydratase
LEKELLITANIEDLPQLAASSYLNTAPLIWSFQHGNQRNIVQLVTDAAPARCADLLARGEVEAALVPIIEYQRIPEISVVANVCVGSHLAVRSVVLVSKHGDLDNVRRVALDTSSRTSQALVKIVFREFLNHEPDWESCGPDLQVMLENNDAALLIGDPAMKMPSQGLHVFDLASLWRRFTDTGFVFAMWMARADAVEAIRKIDFAGARDEGLEQIERIITQYESQVPLSREEIREYLTNNITFQIDESLERGMGLYFELARKHGLIQNNRQLQFITS